MYIWNRLYFENISYNTIIKKLFYAVFEKFHRIPGLKTHDVKLFLKVDNPTRQKDLRPVASLPSIPKRMLKEVYTQAKQVNKDIFYDKNDFSAPGRGAQLVLLNTYEDLERGCNLYQKQNMPKDGSRPKNDKDYVTTLTLYDKSNAFNTTSRKIFTENIAISGNARNLICHSVHDHEEFRVRNKTERSEPKKLVTGGAQGQSPAPNKTPANLANRNRVLVQRVTACNFWLPTTLARIARLAKN